MLNIIKFVSDSNNRPTYDELAAANHKLQGQVKYYQGLEYIKQGQEKLEQQGECLKKRFDELTDEESELCHKIEGMREYIRDSQMEAFLESFGFTESDYNLDASGEYEMKLREIKERQYEILKDNTAIYLCKNPSKDEHAISPQILEVFGKILLSAFNSACQQIILEVTHLRSNYNAQKRKIVDLVKYVKLLSVPIRCIITTEYERLKFAELYICHMAQKKKSAEVREYQYSRQQIDQQKRIMDRIEKDLKAAVVREKELKKEIEVVRRQAKYQTELQAEITYLEQELKAVIEERKALNTRSQLLTAGHIYVASNIGSFGKDTCIIGMTQDLNPLDYLKNLGDNSVPFDFDLHTLVFSENAVEMKNRIHQKFSQQRLNQVNEVKDFFKVSLDEVKLTIKEMMTQDKTAKSKMKFVAVPKAKEYRDTIAKICNNLQ